MLNRYKFPIVLLVAICVFLGSAYETALSEKTDKNIKKEFSIWLKAFKQKALSQGISEKTLSKAFKSVSLNLKLPDLQVSKKKKQKRQPEFASPAKYFPAHYIKSLTLQSRKIQKKWLKTLNKIENEYKVSATIVLSVWGRETAFGKAKIPYYAIEVLATQAFIGNRKQYFSDQLMLALKILEEGHVSIKNMKSSWAGAMGYTQFMPEDFYKHAVDFDQDGRIDIWQSIPDALASTASYLKNNGWKQGLTWGHEVKLPGNLDCRLEGFDKGRSLKDWKNLGLSIIENKSKNNLSDEQKLYLLMPAGKKGPSFLVSDNFLVLKSYNQANLYALFVGHISDRTVHNQNFLKKWPDLKSYSRKQVRELQQHLAAQGYKIGKIDGIIGPKSRSIIGEYQKSNNLQVSCYLDNKLLKNIVKRNM